MTTKKKKAVEPDLPHAWVITEESLDLDDLGHMESVFALSNGHVGLRGNLDEGEPTGMPGTYLNAFFEERPLPYAEAGYGYPEEGQTVVNVTNGKIFRLLVDDEPFDVRYGSLEKHTRSLDLRTGILTRDAEWTSPAGARVRVRSQRLVSFTQRAVAAVRYEVEPIGGRMRVIVQSELVTNEDMPVQSHDPRVAAALERPLVSLDKTHRRVSAVLVHETRASRMKVAAGMSHSIDAPDGSVIETDAFDDWARTTVATVLEPGTVLRLDKFLAYGWSSSRTMPAIRDQVGAALAGARMTGWDDLVAEQKAYLDDFWDGADVEIEGDENLQQAVRFALFQVLQAGARAENRAIPAKGLTGAGYDGHAFWDTEMFVLPVLTATMPGAVADALWWRHSVLDLALERATTLGLEGATFPWRTIRGQECSSYWPAGTAAFHVNAAISAAAVRYVQWTGDERFDSDCAVVLLVETARMWVSLGYHASDGHFHINGVTGPDEYSSVMDDNTYTNLMAQLNLSEAVAACGRWPEQAAARGVTTAELDAWRLAAERMAVPYDEDKKVHAQALHFTNLRPFDLEAADANGWYPLLLHRPYVELYAKQVVKQADLVLAMHWRGDAFTYEEKARAFAYYEPLTVRDSSLSACTQAILAAEVGHLQLAHRYLTEAALIDLFNLQHNTRDGLHIASLGGAWLAVVAGLGGMRDHGGALTFAPRLPSGITSLTFRLRFRDRRVTVTTDGRTATYSLRDHGSRVTLDLSHHGTAFTLSSDEPQTFDVPPPDPRTPEPSQPPGREPLHP